MKFHRQTDDRSMIERCKTGTLHAIWHNLGAVSRHSHEAEAEVQA